MKKHSFSNILFRLRWLSFGKTIQNSINHKTLTVKSLFKMEVEKILTNSQNILTTYYLTKIDSFNFVTKFQKVFTWFMSKHRWSKLYPNKSALENNLKFALKTGKSRFVLQGNVKYAQLRAQVTTQKFQGSPLWFYALYALLGWVADRRPAAFIVHGFNVSCCFVVLPPYIYFIGLSQ